MRYIRGLSADMEDLLTDKGKADAEGFFERFLWSAEQGVYERTERTRAAFTPIPALVPDEECGEKKERDVLIITDLTDTDSNLSRMIERFRRVLGYTTRIVNISEYAFSGGCLGCFRCAVSEKCVYKDGFDSFLRDNIQRADAIVYAFEVRDHSMGSRFKMYDDRNFCNGHRTVTIGMPIGYLVSGTYSAESNLQNIIEARAQVGSNFMAGVATDEVNPDAEIDRLAENLEYALQNCYVPPQNFYGIGGMKVFRDLIWLMQGMMRADHKFYKEHGQYDFPQKKWPDMLKMYLVGELLANPKLKAKAGGKMSEGMIAPYKKVLDKARKQVKKQNRNPFFRIGKQK
jgi:multimeric flavodoxin WrbA